MRNIILFTIFFLSLCVILITIFSESPNEQLAYRMSKSKNFQGLINFWKPFAIKANKLPDSVKNKVRPIKIHIDSLQKNKSLSLFQKADSIIKLGKSMPLMDSEFLNSAKKADPLFKRFFDEFPEFKKMSKEERSSVFKKAGAIFLKNSKI